MTFASPQEPAPGASASTWQAWGIQQSQDVRKAPWAQELASQGDQLTRVVYTTVQAAPGLGIPSGVTMTAVGLGFKVGTPRGSASPDYSTCDSITGPGSACIGVVSDGGGSQLQASYTYYGSGSATGHVMLGNAFSSCPGSNIVSGPNVTLTYGYGWIHAGAASARRTDQRVLDRPRTGAGDHAVVAVL
ncbi:MAG: hypothetical protein ACRDY2_04770 [Acidimicrobiales bacterium]